MIVRMTLTNNIHSYVNIGGYRAIVKYEGQRSTGRLCYDKNRFSNNCSTVRRNRETSNAEKSCGAKKSHVEQAASAKVTLQENMVSSTELSEEISVDPSSEGNEAKETENLTAINELVSPDIPHGQVLPNQAIIIPETRFLGIPVPAVSTVVSTASNTGNIVSIDFHTENAFQTSDVFQTETKRPRIRFLPTITEKNSRSWKPSQIPLPRGIKSAERRQILLNFSRDGNFDVVGLQEVAFNSCPSIESCYYFLSNVGPNKN
ncbi:Uncharacterized protein APZ42_006309, partial [Daphnia magna]